MPGEEKRFIVMPFDVRVETDWDGEHYKSFFPSELAGKDNVVNVWDCGTNNVLRLKFLDAARVTEEELAEMAQEGQVFRCPEGTRSVHISHDNQITCE